MLAPNSAPAPLASVQALMSGAIDYAGLFPPSSVSMSEAVLNYATYRNSNYHWLLGRFIVTAARLDEFFEIAHDFISRGNGDGWRLSVIAGEDIAETIRQIKYFNERNGKDAICDSVEVKAASVSKIENTVESLPKDIKAYFELGLDANLPDLIAAVALRGQRAKMRTGGVTPEAFPDTRAIIRFVKACLAANVAFKATAGLHHPIRCFRPLTYEEGSVKGTMHGFLNLFMMTGFAREGFRDSLLVDVMEEEFEEVFRFDDQRAAWRGEYFLTAWQLERLRQFGIHSFGSCSFDEPVADLQKLGVL